MLDLLGVRSDELHLPRDPLLEQQLRRAHRGIRVEPLAHAAFEQRVAQRDERHALVVSEVGLHHGAPLACGNATGGVVERLVVAVAALCALGGEVSEVADDGARVHGEREDRRVRRHDHIVGESALQAHARHAEGLILIREVGVDRVERRFRDTPRHAAGSAVVDLAAHDRRVRLVEERIGPVAHHEERHEVLEHGRAPAHERPPVRRASERPAEAEPVLLTHVTLGDREEAGDPALAREKIVIAGVEATLAEVVSDGEELTVRVEEHREIGMLPDLARYIGVEAQAREQFDGRRPRVADSVGHGFGPRLRARIIRRRDHEVEGCERAGQAFRESHEAGDKRKQRCELCDIADARGGLGDQQRPRGVLAEQLDRIRNRPVDVGDRGGDTLSCVRGNVRSGRARGGVRACSPADRRYLADGLGHRAGCGRCAQSRSARVRVGSELPQPSEQRRPLAQVARELGGVDGAQDCVKGFAHGAPVSPAGQFVVTGDEVLEREQRGVAETIEQLRAEEGSL